MKILSLGIATCLSACSGTISTESPPQRPENDLAGTLPTDPFAMSPGTPGSSGGSGSGVGGSGRTNNSCANVPVVRRIWRLTTAQYDKTVLQVAAVGGQGSAVFGGDSASAGFSTNSTALTLRPDQTSRLVDATERLGPAAINAAKAYVPCLVPSTGADDPQCARNFIEAFGQRAFRRPLEKSEIDALSTFYSTNRSKFSGALALEMVARAILQSPLFLFRTELGTTGPMGFELTAFERASLLSYSLTDSPPDPTLIASAQSGALLNRAEVEIQAKRLMATPAAENPVGRFGVELVGVSEVADVTKDPAQFPKFTAPLAVAMRDEVEAFSKEVAFRGDGAFKSFLESPVSFLEKSLAGMYGVRQITSATPMRTTLSSSERAGILTRMAVMTVHATDTQTSPVHRGLLVRNEFLCNGALTVPPNIPPAPPIDVSKTHREQLIEHAVNPACSGCHSQMDPLGFAFESYDGIGVYRTTEHGKPIDPSGTARGVVAGGDLSHSGALDLSAKLSALDAAQQCFVRQVGRAYLGREVAPDACELNQAMQSMQRGGLLSAAITYVVESAMALREP